MKINLRKKKLRNGRLRLYIEYYSKGTRTFEFLELKIWERPKDEREREHNKYTIGIAEGIRDARFSDYIAGKFDVISLKPLTLTEYMAKYEAEYPHLDKKKVKRSFALANDFFPQGLLLRRLTPVMVDDFGAKMKKDYPNHDTSSGYFKKFTKMLKRARKEKLLSFSPFEEIDVKFTIPRSGKSKKEYETPENIVKLWNAPGNDLIKRAFIFCLNTGMGYAELVNDNPEKPLRWKHIKKDRIEHKRAKTRFEININLTPEIRMLIGPRKKAEDLVFPLPSDFAVRDNLKKMCEAAGIKRLTFYCGRHIFITNLSELTDPNTLSKLSASSFKHIQGYLHDIDKNKKAAMDKLPSVLGKEPVKDERD